MFTGKRAVAIAYDLEKSLVEKDIFQYFKVSPQFADMLRYLKKGSQRHVSLVKKVLDTLKDVR